MLTVRNSALLILLVVLWIIAPAFPQQPARASWNFEADPLDAPPAGWSVTTPSTSAVVVENNPADGRQCVRINRTMDGSFGNLMRTIDATPYRGSRIRFSAFVRIEAEQGAAGRAQMWLRVDREGGGVGFFDNMQQRPITSAQWRRYEISGDIDEDAGAIAFGVLVSGRSVVWIDDVTIETVGRIEHVNEPARPLTERGLTNLIAFARLYGCVRHFHPSDEAFETDWPRFAIRGVRAVESAGTDHELVQRLRMIFRPVAPTIALASGQPPDDDGWSRPVDADAYLYWEHLGFGQQSAGNAATPSIYRSWRERRAADDPASDAVPSPDEFIVRELVPGVHCRIPLTTWIAGGRTVPEAGDRDVEALPTEWDLPEGFTPSGNDRATRLASVIIAWNVLQHFYPYFDVVDTDWSAVLPDALRRAAEDPDADAFSHTLEQLTASLHDGHARVGAMGMAMRHRLPFAAAWAGDALVVSHVPPDLSNTIATGDMILAIDGETVGDITRLLRNRISAANEGWFRHRALGEILSRRTNEPANLELRRPNGTTYGARLNPVPAYPPAAEPELEKIAELEPGIWYVDLDRITDEDFTQSLLPLIAADGVVFDLRGYPGNLSTIIIAHLIDEPVTCAQWHIPIVRRPDRETMEFQFSNWIVEPRLPRLTGNVAFIIDGRAISYAETYMGIIEHYDLAEIVGERTAGTNGNINVIRLPDGSSIVFTGMKVLKHDGTQHHGVGIEPTVPVSRTIEGIAAGRDELLERAIEIVRDDD